MNMPTMKKFLYSALLVVALPILLQADPVELPMTVAATGKILVDLKVDGEPITCIVDTGSPAFLLMDEAIADKLHLEKKLIRTKLRFFAEDVGVKTYRVKLDNIDVGPWHFENVTALTIDDVRRTTGTGYRDLPNFISNGILGMGFLQQFRVLLDYHRNRFVLTPPEHLTNPPFSLLAPITEVSTGSGSRPFLLDTGSTFSVISSKALEPLGISYISLSGSDPLFKGMARADKLQIGTLTMHDITLEVADHFEDYSGQSAISGIIGYDLLKEMVLDFDFPRHTLTLEKP